MNYESIMFSTIRNHIENEMKKNIDLIINTKKLSHNHPPLRKIVEGCEYCKQYGNVFVIY